MNRVFAICLVFGLIATPHPPVAKATEPDSQPTPTAVVKGMVEAVSVLSHGVQQGEAFKKSIKEISKRLDIQGVSRRCLGKHWETIGEAERKAFRELFGRVLEEIAFPKSAKFFKGTEVEVEEERIEEEKATVLTSVIHPEEGLIEVEYALERKAGTWLVVDVVLDGVSLVRDLRSQMAKIIRENSYEELKRRLQEKLEEEGKAREKASTSMIPACHSRRSLG